MEVLIFCQKLWKLFGVYLNESANSKTKLLSLLSNIYILMMLAYFAITSILYVIIDGKIVKIEDSLFGVLQCFAAAAVIPTYLTLMYHKRKVATFVNNIKYMVEESMRISIYFYEIRIANFSFDQMKKKMYIFNKWHLF